MKKYLTTILFSLISFFLLLIIASNYPVGVSPDSVSYIVVSKNIAEGNGIVDNNGNVLIHWPPVYPITISLFSKILGMDVLCAAKYYSAFLISILFLFFNLIIKKFQIRIYTAIILNVFLLISAPLSVFLMFWSEGLFIVLLLMLIYLILTWIESDKIEVLLFSGVVAGILFLTRYAGVGFIGGVILYLLFEKHKPLRTKLCNSALFSLFAGIVISIWVFYSMSFTSNPTDRELAFHLISLNHLKGFIATLISWLFPSFTKYGTAIIFLVFIWTIVKYKNLRIDFYTEYLSKKYLLLFSLLLTYILFLFCSISLFDFHTPMDNRMLSPLFPLLIILFVPITNHILNHIDMRVPIYSLLIIILTSGFYRFSVRSHTFIQNGNGYTNRTWTNSKTIEHLKNYRDYNIHTNGHDVLILYPQNNNTIYSLPAWISPNTQKKNDAYKKEMADLKKSIKLGKSMLVYFNNITWRYYFPKKMEIINEFKEFELREFEDGFIITHMEIPMPNKK